MRLNVDKIFPKLSIRAKLLVAFVSLALGPTLAVGGWAAREVASGLRARALGVLAGAVAERARAVEALDASVEQDLRFLAVHPAFRWLLQQSPFNRADASRAATEAAFLPFAQGRWAYYQICYIDGAGHEVVRIDYRDGRGVAVPVHALRNQRDRDYVREGLARAPGEIYASPIERNVEHGGIEDPPQLVLRYVLAVGDGRSTSGLLVATQFAEHLFALLEPLQIEGRATLLDEQGTYLASSDGPGAAFTARSSRSLAADESPAVVHRVLSGAGSLVTPGGTAYGFTPIRGPAEAWGRRWVLAVIVPEAEFVGEAWRAGRTIAFGAVLAGTFAALLGALAAWRLSRPLRDLARAAEQVAGGDFSARVFCDTNDEIEDLTGRFNEMTDRLGQAQAALSRWNEELRTAVEERTRELTQEKEKLAGVVAGMEGGLCLIDRDRRVTWANRAFRDEHGEGVVGRRCIEGLGCIAVAGCPGADVFAGRGVMRRLVMRPGAGGEPRHVQVAAAPVHDAAGEVTHVIELSIDVTEAVQREEAVVRAERLSALGRLSATVLHEVANPLAAIKTSLQALLGGSTDEMRVHRFAERAVAEVDRLTAFLRSFSTFARPRPPERVPVNLAEAAHDAADLVEHAIHGRRLKLDLTLDDMTVPADGGQIRQVLLNLLLNAIDASPEGGRLALAVRPAMLDGSPAVGIEVTDEGRGMDDDTRRRIFDPFFSTKPHGTGLGLSVVHQIVSEHGGRVDVESAPGKGARFRVTLPETPVCVERC